MHAITPEQRQAIEAAGDAPVLLEDPETHEAFILLRSHVYNRLQPLTEEAPAQGLSLEEQKAYLAHAGYRAGWDDPRMDVYNELDPRRNS